MNRSASGGAATMTGAQLVSRLVAEGTVGPGRALGATSWSNGPGDRYSAHEHDYDKVLVVAGGAIAFTLPDTGRTIELEAGDRLDLPAGTRHAAAVHATGVACVEAHVPPGSLAALAIARGWSTAETGRTRGS